MPPTLSLTVHLTIHGSRFFGTLSIGAFSLFGKNIGGFYAPYVGKFYCDCSFSLLKHTAVLSTWCPQPLLRQWLLCAPFLLTLTYVLEVNNL